MEARATPNPESAATAIAGTAPAGSGLTETDLVAEIGRIIGSSLDIGQVHDEFCEAVSRLVPFNRLSISSVDLDNATLTMDFVLGAEVDGWNPGQVHRLPKSLVPATPQPGDAFILDREKLHGYAEIYPPMGSVLAAGFRSFLIAPLVVHDRVMGLLTFESHSDHAYSLHHRELAIKVAYQISPAVENARLHRQERLLAEEHARRVSVEAERDEFQRMNEAKTKLLSLISHELKTPLTGISAFSELLSENPSGNLTPCQLQQIGLIRRSAERLGLLINDLLDLSRLDAGEFKLKTRDFNPREMLMETAAVVEPIFRHERQQLQLDVDCAGATIRGDSDRLSQVVSNLLTNASKFSPPGSEVSLHAEVDSGAFRVKVCDHGIGIADDDRRRLFTAFFRADNRETRSVPGTGLGLYIAKSIVTLHGGTISVESARGAGSTFTVEIPRIPRTAA